MALTAQNTIVLSFTNNAVENVKERPKGICDKEGIDDLSDICHTFDSYFCEYHSRDIPHLKGKTTFIEEYSMVPNKWVTQIYQAFSKYCNTIYMFGDVNQCDPIEGHSQVHYDYHTSKTIMEMCPCSRYDTQTRDMLTKFLKTGKVRPEFPAIGKYYRNIYYLNKTRKIVTETCCKEFVNDKNHYEVKYNGKMERYKVAVDMPVIVTQNLKRDCMFNMMEFAIDEINEHGTNFKVNDTWFELIDFRKSFIPPPPICCTAYIYQGADIDEHYNILDVIRMDKKQLYRCLTPNYPLCLHPS